MSIRKIEVVDYDSDWVRRFYSEKLALEAVLDDVVVKIEHIGSTSIPGLAAKPIIDILIETHKLERLDSKADSFLHLGYKVKGEHGISGRRYYQKGDDNRTHHIHAFQSGSLGLLRHRAFKKYLLAHPNIAKEYADIKRQAAYNCNNDTERYVSMKNEFIVKHEKLAVD
ncbi:GrpB family protein [Glaciecola siphonariae]|uniref:GrpB family protein n=1 Tax=Glaciecola siphonariae TaxID=521012 RepID=A0ABV9LVS1_9ALTE